jgi:transposase
MTPVLSGLRVTSLFRAAERWEIDAESGGTAGCPRCGVQSAARHSRYTRVLRDLPVQGLPVVIRLRSSRWRCRNLACELVIFTERMPQAAASHARRTSRLDGIVGLLAHAVGGRPAEKLAVQLGFPISRHALLRQLKQATRRRQDDTPLRVVGIDEWAWRRGTTFGTMLVDLERREVVDVLPDRSSASTADWLRQHPAVEIVSRDRYGLYAEGARQGAPQARQVADRFHLVKNLRERIEQQLSRLERPLRHRPLQCDDAGKAPQCSPRGNPQVAEHEHLIQSSQRQSLETVFTEVRALHAARKTAAQIVRELGLSRKRVDKWIRLETLPDRNRMMPKPRSPGFYRDHLAKRWADGCTDGRRLMVEIQALGYSGSYSRLADFLSRWRRNGNTARPVASARPDGPVMPRDPATGGLIAPGIAAALCMQPRSLLNARQAAKVDVLKDALPEFAIMRRLAIGFRTLLRAGTSNGLDRWLHDAAASGVYAMQRFARTLKQDIDAVRNAVTETWSNGQTEGQINRLKTLKRAMYGKAGAELLRARMLPWSAIAQHQT